MAAAQGPWSGRVPLRGVSACGGRTIRQELAVLAQHCADLRRPYEAIEKTLSTRLASGESSDEFDQPLAATHPGAAGRSCPVSPAW